MNNISTNVTGTEIQESSPGSIVTRWLDVEKVSVTKREMGQAGRSDSDSESSISAGKTITFSASIESEDRAGDVIRAEGWELDNYRQNPVVLWAHRHDLLPIGKSVDIWVENGSLYATVEFAQTEFALEIQKLFEGGFLRGVSVGFRALKTSPRGSGHQRGTVFERQELLEISAAPVPMHPGALAAKPAGFDTPSAKKTNESEERELLPLFRQLTEIWQSIAAISK